MKTINELRKEKIEYSKTMISGFNREIKKLEAQGKENKTGIEKWLDYDFQSSSGLTEEYEAFSKDFKKHLQGLIKNDFELVGFNRGHFYISGFMKNKSTGKYVYFSTSDIRGNNGWYDWLLIRTAQHENAKKLLK